MEDVTDSFSEVELPDPSAKNDFLKAIESSGEEVDIFLENCSSLYNLILDSLHNLTSKTISCECLDEMTSTLDKSAKKILAERPEAENSVLLRLNTICCAMEQLRVQHNAKLMSGAESDTSSSARSSTSSSTGEMRSWLHDVERRLEVNEKRIRVEPNLSKLLIDQQALQTEVKDEGQLLVNRLNKQLQDENDVDSSEKERRKTCVDAIRKKWYSIYLNSLALVCRIEDLIQQRQASEDSESDPDLVGPPIKRARTRTGDLTASDTDDSDDERHSQTETVVTDEDNVLPFAESEYESIMDGRITVDSCTSSSEDPMVEESNKKWDSVQQDVGYSSGENSIHEALNTCADHLLPETSDMRRKRIECSPVKAFYRTVQLEDMSDLEVTKAINHDVEEDQNLSDSMYVNHDSTFPGTQNLPEYDEVMALMDNDELPADISMTESFNTKWREIHGQKKPMRRASRPSREQMDIIAKSSCDASSEDSSDGENPQQMDDEADLMSVSFNSASFDASSPLKRQRSGRGLKNASFLYDSLDMEGSFCSTRSETLPPCKTRSLARRKLRVRRMPRSMSDGEQLGVKSTKPEGLMTPMIRVSPPSTPVTRLLRRLDAQIRNGRDSDTAPEHSDHAQAYEWDEYNPPQKDDSSADRHTPTMADISSQLMNIDDDFAEHFGGSSAIRLIEESKSHLRVVHKALEESNANMPQLSNFELIARSNLRQVDEALKIHSGYQPSFLETSTLQDLRAEWAELYESIRSPFARIMHQVKKFAATLQEVSSMASLGDVVDIQSKEDVLKALDAVTAIEKRLSCERQELRELVASPTFREVATDLTREFNSVSEGYDDAVDRIGKMAHSLSTVKGEWDAWNSRQNDIRSAMVRIESHLKEGQVDNKLIAEEMELCQERMNSLETMCNYLTASLSSLQNESNSKSLPDFKAELSIYSNALARLKDRFSDMVRIPSPPVQFHPPEPRPSKSSMTTQTAEMESECEDEPMTVTEAISSSRLIKFTFALSLLTALAAIFYYHVFGKPFGPHMTYVNGPPPV